MKIDGGCHCGRIRFHADVDPSSVAICHCTDCQTLSGAPYRAVVPADAENFDISGDVRIYIKTADSGARRAQAFCPDCGSSIYASDADDPSLYSIRLGAIRQRNALGTPKRQIWCDSALPWVTDLRSISARPRQS